MALPRSHNPVRDGRRTQLIVDKLGLSHRASVVKEANVQGNLHLHHQAEVHELRLCVLIRIALELKPVCIVLLEATCQRGLTIGCYLLNWVVNHGSIVV